MASVLVGFCSGAHSQTSTPLELRKSYVISQLPSSATPAEPRVGNAPSQKIAPTSGAKPARRADPDPPHDPVAAAAAAERQAVLRASITPSEPRRVAKDELGDSFANRVLRVQAKRPPILQIALPD
jgi:hypothetical protein